MFLQNIFLGFLRKGIYGFIRSFFWDSLELVLPAFFNEILLHLEFSPGISPLIPFYIPKGVRFGIPIGAPSGIDHSIPAIPDSFWRVPRWKPLGPRDYSSEGVLKDSKETTKSGTPDGTSTAPVEFQDDPQTPKAFLRNAEKNFDQLSVKLNFMG